MDHGGVGFAGLCREGKFSALREEAGRSCVSCAEGARITDVERKGGLVWRGGEIPITEGKRVVEAGRKRVQSDYE